MSEEESELIKVESWAEPAVWVVEVGMYDESLACEVESVVAKLEARLSIEAAEVSRRLSVGAAMALLARRPMVAMGAKKRMVSVWVLK